MFLYLMQLVLIRVYQLGDELLSIWAPPGVLLAVVLHYTIQLPAVLALPAHLVSHDLFPVLSQYEIVPADLHLDQHEMLAGGRGPDLAAVPVAEVQPATIPAVRAREVLPLLRWSELRLVQVVIHEHPLALSEPWVGLGDQLALGISIVPHAGLFTGHAV